MSASNQPPDPFPGYHREWTYDSKGNRLSYVDKFSDAYSSGCLLPIVLMLLAALVVR